MTPDAILAQYGPREAMEYDVVVVGAGPAGLATAIRLKQLAQERSHEVSVVVLEKGSEPGAHILSGAIMDPRALTELLPKWKEDGAPLNQPVTADRFLFLTETGAKAHARLLPARLLQEPRQLRHQPGQRGQVARRPRPRRSASRSFPALPAAEVLYAENGAVKGVATGNMGVGKDGEPTESFQLGMELHGKYTIFAEGARGSLGRQLISRFSLDAGKDPQSYAIGVKELWEVVPSKASPGLVIHTAGWPLDPDTYGGSFLYHLDNNQVELGFVVGLDYTQPLAQPVRGDAALEDASGDPEDARGRQAPRLRRARASPPAASSACRRRCFPAAPSSAAKPATSTPAGSRAAMPPSRPACSPPKPRSRRWSPGAAATS